jgi:hypothetical protein
MSKASRTLSPSVVMRKAWAAARAGARRFGGAVRPYLAEALRQAWAEAKRSARDLAAMRARVSAEVERIRAEGRARLAAGQVRREAARKLAVLPRRAYAGPAVTGDEDGFLARLAAGQARAAAATAVVAKQAA